MNKIKVVNDNLELVNVSKNIQVEYYEKECLFSINDLKINISDNSELDIEINLKDDNKINLNINIEANKKLNLNIYTNSVISNITSSTTIIMKNVIIISFFMSTYCLKVVIKISIYSI